MSNLTEYRTFAANESEVLQNVQAEIQDDADVNERGSHKGWTPLHWAASSGFTDVCECLMNNGANVALTDDDGCTPAHLAAKNGHVDVCKYLIEQAGANPNAVDSEGKTLLLQALWLRALPLIKYLINKQKVDVNQSDNSGRTCLHLIVNSPSPLEFLKYFIEEAGANINAASTEARSTPLQVAAFIASAQDSLEAFHYLLDCGATVPAVNDPNDSSKVNRLLDVTRGLDLEIALIKSPDDFIQFLEKHKNDPHKKLAFNRALSHVSKHPGSYELSEETDFVKIANFLKWIQLNPKLVKTDGSKLTNEELWNAFRQYLSELSQGNVLKNFVSEKIPGQTLPNLRKGLQTGNLDSGRPALPEELVTLIFSKGGHEEKSSLAMAYHEHLAGEKAEARRLTPAQSPMTEQASKRAKLLAAAEKRQAESKKSPKPP